MPKASTIALALTTLFAAAAMTGGARAERILVSNEKDNTVTVLDSDTLKIVKTIPVGARPRGIIMSKDGKSLYVATSDDDHIEVIDLATLTVTRTLQSGPDPETFDISPDGKMLYVSNENDSMVSIVDIAAGQVVTEIPTGVEPEGMGVSPDGKTVVNTSETTSMAHFIDVATHKVVASVLVQGRPRHAQWTNDGKQVWVSSEIGDSVTVIDAATHKIITRIKFEIPGIATESNPAGRHRDHQGRFARVRRAGTGEPGRRDRCEDIRDQEIPAGRPAGLEPRLLRRREEAVHDQRREQRHFGHRRTRSQGDKIGARRAAALGRGGGAVTRAR